MRVDWVGVALIIGGVSLLAFVICSAHVVWNNSASRNIVLTAGTVVGAIFLFIVQLFFELQSSTRTEFITSELTIDRSLLSIGQWKYTQNQVTSKRQFSDLKTSQWLKINKREAFDGDREKLSHDMTLFSIIQYMAFEHVDWRITGRSSLRGSDHTIPLPRLLSADLSECAMLDLATIHQHLEAIKNIFANAPIVTMTTDENLCLPPETIFSVTAESISIRNPFCTISVSISKPTIQSIVGKQALLPNGEQQIEKRLTGLRITVEYSKVRAQHRKMEVYRNWADQFFVGLENWFKVPVAKDHLELPPMEDVRRTTP